MRPPTALFSLALLTASLVLCRSEASPPQPEAVASEWQLPPNDAAGARMRVEWEQQSIDPFPPPIDPARFDQYSWGKLGQGLALLLLDRDQEFANELVRDAVASFLAPDGSLRPYGPNKEGEFHWHGNLLFRIYALFSHSATYRPGRLEPATERAIEELFWQYANVESALTDAESGDYWRIWGSENHHLMRFSTLWSASAILQKAPAYRDREFSQGGTPAQHHLAWNRYFSAYLREHFGRGLWMEAASPGYLKYSFQCLYNFSDFAEDTSVRNAANASLDLHWSAWAVEQVDGLRGGGKVRAYSGPMSTDPSADGSNALGWYYFGVGPVSGQRHPAFLAALSSAYRPPAALSAWIGADRPPLPSEQLRSRVPGRARIGDDGEKVEQLAVSQFYYLNPEASGIVRTTWRTPEFALGTLSVEPAHYETWCKIVAQNHWNGLVIPGSPPTLIPVRTAGDGRERSTYNGERAVQHHGTALIQGMTRGSLGRYIWPLSVTVPPAFKVEKIGEWYFTRVGGTGVAFRAADRGFKEREPGVFTVKNRASPVILQAAALKDFAGGFEEFVATVSGQTLAITDGVVTFQSALDDAALTIDLACEQSPTVDGSPLAIAGAAAWSGDSLSQAWGSQKATLSVPGQDSLVISTESARLATPPTAVW